MGLKKDQLPSLVAPIPVWPLPWNPTPLSGPGTFALAANERRVLDETNVGTIQMPSTALPNGTMAGIYIDGIGLTWDITSTTPIGDPYTGSQVSGATKTRGVAHERVTWELFNGEWYIHDRSTNQGRNLDDLFMTGQVDNYGSAFLGEFGSTDTLVMGVSGGPHDLTGMAAPVFRQVGAINYPYAAEQKFQRTLIIQSGSLVVKHQSGSSLSANQFSLPGASDLAMTIDNIATFTYRALNGKWLLMSKNF